MQVGFIGIGNIGKPMAEQIIRGGHTLVAHDLRRDAATLVAEGVVWAGSPAEVATRMRCGLHVPARAQGGGAGRTRRRWNCDGYHARVRLYRSHHQRSVSRPAAP